MTALIPIEKVNGAEVFAGNYLDNLLETIRKAALSDDYDLTTVSGRKEVASRAYNVSRSKTVIDDAGKELVSEWKEKAKKVDAARKKARDYLDALRDEVRAPLNEYEAEEKRKAQEAVDELNRVEAEAEAKRLAEIEAREAELAAREKAILDAENAAREKAEQERLEIERKEREEAIAKAAAENAEREKREALEREKAAVAKAERDAIEAAERAEKEKARAVAEAESRAKEQAERAQREVEAIDAAKRAEVDRLERNKEHRRSVNSSALASLVENGINEDIAKKVVTLIASDAIQGVMIDYSVKQQAA